MLTELVFIHEAFAMMSVCLNTVITVAYFTLMERKLLAGFQTRLGPDKVGLKGLLQPISDALKLFFKEFIVPESANEFMFLMGPCLMMALCVGIWVLFPSLYGSVYFKWGLLAVSCISSASVYGLIIVGWTSNSKYAYLGCVRAVAQFISYEIVMVAVMLVVAISVKSFDLLEISEMGLLSVQAFLAMFAVWMISILAETNRAPFDFVEGESELVSGFNVEFGGVGFALIFIAEYSVILFMSVLTAVIFFGAPMMGVFSMSVVVLMVSSFIILCRGGLPRFRYDLLMMLTWKYLLPVVLVFISLVVVSI